MFEIMIVDDDDQLIEMVDHILRREGYNVRKAYSANQALALVEESIPDLFLIDSMMPDKDGMSLCKELRSKEQTSNVPILFLTAEQSPHRLAEALNSGADDYIRKPFAPRELTARVRAHLRRIVNGFDAEQLNTIQIYLNQYRAVVNSREVNLTRVEFELLVYLCEHPYEISSVDSLLEGVWGYPYGIGDSALVRNHIHNLRQKIELDPEKPTIIQSRHGRGYLVKAKVEFTGIANRLG